MKVVGYRLVDDVTKLNTGLITRGAGGMGGGGGGGFCYGGGGNTWG